LASSSGVSASRAAIAVQSSDENGFSRVRQVRGCASSLGSFHSRMYFRAVFRSMSALTAARPTSPCLVISSISFLTCASVVCTQPFSADADPGYA
jgi:hypothetical protein